MHSSIFELSYTTIVLYTMFSLLSYLFKYIAAFYSIKDTIVSFLILSRAYNYIVMYIWDNIYLLFKIAIFKEVYIVFIF